MLVMKNITSNERMKVDEEGYVNIYDHGILRNIKEVLFTDAVGQLKKTL